MSGTALKIDDSLDWSNALLYYVPPTGLGISSMGLIGGSASKTARNLVNPNAAQPSVVGSLTYQSNYANLKTGSRYITLPQYDGDVCSFAIVARMTDTLAAAATRPYIFGNLSGSATKGFGAYVQNYNSSTGITYISVVDGRLAADGTTPANGISSLACNATALQSWFFLYGRTSLTERKAGVRGLNVTASTAGETRVRNKSTTGPLTVGNAESTTYAGTIDVAGWVVGDAYWSDADVTTVYNWMTAIMTPRGVTGF